MDMQSYVECLRRRISQLEINRAAIIELILSGREMKSRWGLEPFVDRSGACLTETQRRIRELNAVADALEQSRPI